MSKVFGQIIIDLEMDEQTISGTRLDLIGITALVRDLLENNYSFQQAGNVRVLETYTPTKDWQIGAWLNLGQPFEEKKE